MATTCLYGSPCKTGYIFCNVSLGSLIAATFLTAICCGISLLRFMENHKYVCLTFHQLNSLHGCKASGNLGSRGSPKHTVSREIQSISILLVTKCQRRRKENGTNIYKMYTGGSQKKVLRFDPQ